MKPTVSFLTCFILLFSVLISCTKTVTKTVTVTVTDTIKTPATYSIQGLWIGTYLATTVPSQPAYFYSFDIQPGGNLLVQAKGPTDTTYATGTWTLTGDTLKCNFTYFISFVEQNATAIFNNTGTLTSGTWQDVYNFGTFTMNRVE